MFVGSCKYFVGFLLQDLEAPAAICGVYIFAMFGFEGEDTLDVLDVIAGVVL